MKVLLVVTSASLPFAITNALSAKNSYCAIVVDEPMDAKNFAKKVGLSENLIYPLYELKECISDFYYDVLICISDGLTGYDDLANYVQRCGCPTDKFIHLRMLNDPGNFFIERALRYYDEHSGEIEMFATGNSHTCMGLDANQFKYKLLNFGRSSQDLYYGYQIAKRVLTPPKQGGGTNIRYALIGLAPYFFQTDQSLYYSENFRLLSYAIAFKDLHNFWLKSEQYCDLFNEEFISIKLPLERLDINNVMGEKTQLRFMNFASRMKARERTETWKNKYYPNTRTEYLKIFDNYLSLCEENSVRPIMFLLPVSECYKKYYSKRILSEFYHFIGEANKKYPNAGFIDGWRISGFEDSDFYDVDHMNIKGAAKFSKILNGVIEQLEKNDIH